MLCSYCPMNDSSGYLRNTVYIAVTLEAYWQLCEKRPNTKLFLVRIFLYSD